MSHNKVLLFLLLLSSGYCGHAQNKKQDKIDEEFRKCLLADTSYANISDCSFDAFAKWDKELAKAYDKVLDKLKKETEKTTFKEAQKAWLAYKDAEFNAYDHMFNMEGDKWSIMRMEGRIEVVRERTLQLRAYVAAFEQR